MSEVIQKCPVCGKVLGKRLGSNCPACLMRLAAPALPEAASSGDQRTASGDGYASGCLRRLGGYELIEEIAHGGMGVVYRSRQIGLNRMVAVKVLLGGQFANPAFVERFRREAEAAASLNHPNIVSIHEVGEHRGQPYFSMELIEGRSLAEVTREQPPSTRQAAQWLKTIAEAIHYAHERGVLHRDLKPSNVVVDAEGNPHITDFGLAKFVTEPGTPGPQDITIAGQVLGSPNYMPPEQADPKRGPATVASDVYSLGAILYHLLTGRPPFLADSMAQTLRLVAESEPVAPQLLNPALPRDLETICLKCLEKEPHRRYGSARELAEELGRFLNDELIHARPIGVPGRLVRWRRRKPALAATLGIAALLLLVVLLGLPIALIRIDRARMRAESAERATEGQLYTALLEQARATVRSGELGQRVQALDAARRAITISNTAELRREVFAALALPDLKFERELERPPGLSPRKMDPELKRLAWSRGRSAIEIRDAVTQQLLVTLPASTNLPASSVTWSRDGKLLAGERDHDSAGERADVEVWNVPEARRTLLFKDVPWGATAFHPSQRQLMVAQKGGGVAVMDLDDGRELARFALARSPRSLHFAPDGSRFAASHPSDDGWRVSVYYVAHGALAASVMISNFVQAIDWHPDGRLLAICDDSGAVHLIHAQTGESELLGRHKAVAATSTFSPDGGYLMTGGWENELICWDVRARRRAFTMRANGFNAQWSADGQRCVVFTDAGVQLHRFERPTSRREFPEDLGVQRQAAFSPDGHWLAVSGDDRLGVWDLSGDGRAALSESGRLSHLFFSPQSGELFSNREGSFRRWRVSFGEGEMGVPVLEPLSVRRPDGFYSACLFSNHVALTGSGGTRVLPLEDIATGGGESKRTAQGRNGISPGGRWLVVNPSFSPFLYIYRMPGLERVAKLTNQANVASFVFTPSGDALMAGSRQLIEFWSTKSWQKTRELPGFRSALFSPETNTVWLTRDYSTAGLYDFRTMEPLLLLPVGMLPLAVSPDGGQLAVTVDNRRLQVWNLSAVRAQLRDLGMDWRP